MREELDLDIDLKEFSKYIVDSGSRYYVGDYLVLRFENNYGVDIVNDFIERNTFEVAVLCFPDKSNHYLINETTEITDDVLREQSNEEVLDILKRVQELPKFVEKDYE